MSCFGGKMREYSRISIDRFDSVNLKSTAFFLSHCHKDHMAGLDSPRFVEHLSSSKDIFLYCTEVTKIILLADASYKPLEKHIKVLHVGIPATVVIPDHISNKETVLVTPLQAGHCPGSVMFLYEGSEGTALYTGDFRWESNEAASISHFKSGDGVKDIDSLYIDTTFCVPNAFYIPSRQDSIQALCSLASKWLEQGLDKYINISSKTSIGHESLLAELSRSSGMKIHVSEYKYRIYRQIPELEDVFTTDPSETSIHAGCWTNNKDPASKLPCGYIPPDGQHVDVITVRPSTMWFTQRVNGTKDVINRRGHFYRVCYSFHSSYSEVRELVTYLKPKRVYPNVRPINDISMQDVQARLNRFITMPHKDSFSMTPKFKSFGMLRKGRRSNLQGSLSDSEELVFSSPVKKRKRSSSVSSSASGGLVKIDKNGVKSDVETPSKSIPSLSQSSYNGSQRNDSELSLSFSDGDDDGQNAANKTDMGGGDGPTGSYMSYISGESDLDDDDDISVNKGPETGDLLCSYIDKGDASQDTLLVGDKGDTGCSSTVVKTSNDKDDMVCSSSVVQTSSDKDDTGCSSFVVKSSNDKDDTGCSSFVVKSSNDKDDTGCSSFVVKSSSDKDDTGCSSFVVKSNNDKDDTGCSSSVVKTSNDKDDTVCSSFVVQTSSDKDDTGCSSFVVKSSNDKDDTSCSSSVVKTSNDSERYSPEKRNLFPRNGSCELIDNNEDSAISLDQQPSNIHSVVNNDSRNTRTFNQSPVNKNEINCDEKYYVQEKDSDPEDFSQVDDDDVIVVEAASSSSSCQDNNKIKSLCRNILLNGTQPDNIRFHSLKRPRTFLDVFATEAFRQDSLPINVDDAFLPNMDSPPQLVDMSSRKRKNSGSPRPESHIVIDSDDGSMSSDTNSFDTDDFNSDDTIPPSIASSDDGDAVEVTYSSLPPATSSVSLLSSLMRQRADNFLNISNVEIIGHEVNRQQPDGVIDLTLDDDF